MKKRKDLERMSAAMMKVKSPLKNGEGPLTSPKALKKQEASRIGTGEIKIKLGKSNSTEEKESKKPDAVEFLSRVTNIPLVRTYHKLKNSYNKFIK